MTNEVNLRTFKYSFGVMTEAAYLIKCNIENQKYDKIFEISEPKASITINFSIFETRSILPVEE